MRARDASLPGSRAAASSRWCRVPVFMSGAQAASTPDRLAHADRRARLLRGRKPVSADLALFRLTPTPLRLVYRDGRG